MSYFSDNWERILEEAGIKNLRQLAIRAGIGDNTVRDFAHYGKNPRQDTLEAIAKALNKRVDFLLTGNEYSTEQPISIGVEASMSSAPAEADKTLESETEKLKEVCKHDPSVLKILENLSLAQREQAEAMKTQAEANKILAEAIKTQAESVKVQSNANLINAENGREILKKLTEAMEILRGVAGKT